MDNNINYIAFDFVEENNNEISPENVEVEITALDQYKIAEYTANASGVLPTFNEGYQYTVNETELNGIYTVEISSDDDFTSCSFDSKSNLLTVEYLKVTSKVTAMDDMFYNCSQLTQIDVSNFDTSKVTTMSNMFCNCSQLTQLNLSKWNTSKVTTMSNMFYNCSQLTQLDLSNFDTSKVTTMSNMFNGCTNLILILMNNSDYNSVNKIISALPTRTSDSPGTLNIVGVDDYSQVDITTAQSKFWNVLNLKRYKVHLISINNNKINKVHNLNKKLKISFYK